MIISVSRRTDIPAFYSEWFFNRLKAGEVLVRNPMNARQISKIKLTPDAVDGIVFWTKNPAPMLDRLYLLKDYIYYFQFTLNAYGKEIESGVPSKNRFVIPTFQRLSDLIGPDRIVWRYDPIFLNETYTIDYHIYYFEKLARRLSPFTRKCTISFLDSYRNIESLQVCRFASLRLRFRTCLQGSCRKLRIAAGCKWTPAQKRSICSNMAYSMPGVLTTGSLQSSRTAR